MGIFLYAFATGKLLAVAEKEDQEVAMWILVCWNLAASMLHPIVFSVVFSKGAQDSVFLGRELKKNKIMFILCTPVILVHGFKE